MNLKLKKLLSSLLDIVFGVLLFALFSNTICNLIITKCTNYNNLVNSINDILLETGLYKQDGDNIVLIDDNIDNKLIIYYQNHDYIDSNHKAISYEDAKEKSGLFDNINGTYFVKIDAEDNDLKEFYEQELYNASISIANLPEYKTIKRQIDDINTYNAYITLFSVSLICLVIIPICNKKRKTLGNVIMKLKLSSESEKITFMTLIIRFIAFFAIELLPSLTFYGIPLCISLIMMMFSKKDKYIHDYFAFTYLEEDIKGVKYETKN